MQGGLGSCPIWSELGASKSLVGYLGHGSMRKHRYQHKLLTEIHIMGDHMLIWLSAYDLSYSFDLGHGVMPW